MRRKTDLTQKKLSGKKHVIWKEESQGNTAGDRKVSHRGAFSRRTPLKWKTNTACRRFVFLLMLGWMLCATAKAYPVDASDFSGFTAGEDTAEWQEFTSGQLRSDERLPDEMPEGREDSFLMQDLLKEEDRLSEFPDIPEEESFDPEGERMSSEEDDLISEEERPASEDEVLIHQEASSTQEILSDEGGELDPAQLYALLDEAEAAAGQESYLGPEWARQAEDYEEETKDVSSSPVVINEQSSALREEGKNPSFTVSKTADTTTARPGDTVTYTIRITNTGNVVLHSVLSTERFQGAGIRAYFEEARGVRLNETRTQALVPQISPGETIALHAYVIIPSNTRTQSLVNQVDVTTDETGPASQTSEASVTVWGNEGNSPAFYTEENIHMIPQTGDPCRPGMLWGLLAISFSAVLTSYAVIRKRTE